MHAFDLSQDGKLHQWTLDDMRAVVRSTDTDRHFPCTITRETGYDTVSGLFVDVALDGMVYEFKVHILHKLIPGLGKLGFEAGTTSSATTASSSASRVQPRGSGIPRPGYPEQRGPPPFAPALDPYSTIPPRYVEWRPPPFLEPVAPDEPSAAAAMAARQVFFGLVDFMFHCELVTCRLYSCLSHK